MARLHHDIHVISADDCQKALSLLIDAGLVRFSHRDLRTEDTRLTRARYPKDCSFFEIISFY